MAVQTVAAEASGGDSNGQTVTVFGRSFVMFLREHGEQIVWSGDPLQSQVYNYFAKER